MRMWILGCAVVSLAVMAELAQAQETINAPTVAAPTVMAQPTTMVVRTGLFGRRREVVTMAQPAMMMPATPVVPATTAVVPAQPVAAPVQVVEPRQGLIARLRYRRS